jgi:hypothetical protein
MSRLCIPRMFLFVVALLPAGASLGGIVLIDDFSWPGTADHSSLPGESRAAFPPGTSGGSIIPLGGGSDIAADRGLFGETGNLTAGAGVLALAIPTGFVEFDWEVGGYHFSPKDIVVLENLQNLGTQDISLRVQLFQTFDGTNNIVGSAVVDIVLAAGETRDVAFSTVAGATDFVGFRLVNQSSSTFEGRLEGVIAVPEPSAAVLLLIGGIVVGFMRGRKNNTIA